MLLSIGRRKVVAARRQQFDGGDPLAVGQPPASRDFSANGGGRLRLRRSSAAVIDRLRPAPAASGLIGLGHLADVLGRGAAAAADGRRAQVDVPLGVGRSGTRASRGRSAGSRLPWACRRWAARSAAAASAAPPARRRQAARRARAAVHAPGDRLRAAVRQAAPASARPTRPRPISPSLDDGEREHERHVGQPPHGRGAALQGLRGWAASRRG